MPMCIKDNEMFESDSWDLKSYQEDCKKKFGVAFERPDDAVREYGGKEAPFSNIIFSNGLLDPWSAGGNLQAKTSATYSILIPNAAHHLDLRASNPQDPQSVVSARQEIVKILRAWINIYDKQHQHW